MLCVYLSWLIDAFKMGKLSHFIIFVRRTSILKGDLSFYEISDICRYLQLDVTPFQYDIPLCMGVEGVCMTKSIVAILGWVDLRVGIASLGLVSLRFWVADTVSCKGTPFVLGSNQIKRIFNQVNTANADSWPQPWRSMHYRFFYGNWSESHSEDLYDSEDYDTEKEDSFEALCKLESQSTPNTSNNSLVSWLKQIEYPTPHEEVGIHQDNEEGIPDLVSDENGNLTPTAQEECPLPSMAQEHSGNGGGESSVFTNLASKSEGQAADAGLPACNIEVPTPPTPQFGKLTSYPFVSCRVTLSEEAVFNLQWV